MGNQLTGIAPSQILPVEHYLTDVTSFHFERNLGSTRFFKVARAQSKEGAVVVKVFVIHDPSLPLRVHKDALDSILAQLHDRVHYLPFQRTPSTRADERAPPAAALLYRQYVKDSLYDRMSTRPFLSGIEKKWIAFQLLFAVNRCHRLGVCHGDIKAENVMVTSWNWVLLVDFASFKPTYLPEDNPADFSYFFDTSRRRTCYLAPERFVESSWRTAGGGTGGTGGELGRDSSQLDLTAGDVKTGDLTPAMDIFSVGCVLTELFTDGTPPFDLSELLAYRAGVEYTPARVIGLIDNPDVRELVQSMVQRDPAGRRTAGEYLTEQRGRAFPDYFYSLLIVYCQRFAGKPILTPDERVARVGRDLDRIFEQLKVTDDTLDCPALVVIASLVTSCVRQLQRCSSKLTALDLLVRLARHVSADVALDRLLPYILHLAGQSERFPAVRGAAVRAVTRCLAAVRAVPSGDANVFREYVLKELGHLSADPVTMVRVAYAESVARLADTARLFLDIVQLGRQDWARGGEGGDAPSGGAGEAGGMAQYKQTSYDVELQALHEMVQTKVVTLLSDPDNIIKQTLLESGIASLCVFFGRQKASDILVSHMITFLNDKSDWRLRAAFYSSVGGVAAYIGWQSSAFLQPLLEQGLSDTEEFVITRALGAMAAATELGLLRKSSLRELVRSAAHFLVHPDAWVRHGAVGFMVAVATRLDVADLHCHVLTALAPFLRRAVLRADDPVVLLSALRAPLPRPLYEQVLKSVVLEPLLACLAARRAARLVARHGREPEYTPPDEPVAAALRKLASLGLSGDEEEDKVVAMADHLIKLHRAKAAAIESATGRGGLPGVAERHPGEVNLAPLARICRQVDLRTGGGPGGRGGAYPRRQQATLPEASAVMNDDWKAMFGPSLLHPEAKPAPALLLDKPRPDAGAASGTSDVPDQMIASQSSTSSAVMLTNNTPAGPGGGGGGGWASEAARPIIAPCKLNLRELIQRKVEQFRQDCAARDLLTSGGVAGGDDVRPVVAGWKPQGLLVAHLHEHRGAVNRVRVSADQTQFATCSNDGSVKVWDCERLEGRSITNRSRYTYNKQGGQIKTLCFCDASQSVASASDAGSIHVFRADAGSSRVTMLHTRPIDLHREGLVVDMTHFDTGAENIIAYATVHGLLVGWDLRCPVDRAAWTLQNDPQRGLVTSMDVHRELCWLAVGTSAGQHVCWDMRFQLPINTVTHPMHSRVRRLLINNAAQSSLLSSVQGNNEVSSWDVETGARQRTLWASTAPPLSQTQASAHCVNGMCIVHASGGGVTGGSTYLLTAGTDMRIRYWDLAYPSNSQIVVSAATDPPNNVANVSYRARILEGSEVVQEVYSKPPAAAGGTGGGGGVGVGAEEPSGPDRPAPGHHDIITDVAMCRVAQNFVITSSRDGMVKVWK